MKSFFSKLKWIISKSKGFRLYIGIIAILGTLMSLLSVYSTLLSKKLVDSATAGNTSVLIKYLIAFASIILLNMLLNTILSILGTYAASKLNFRIQEDLYNHIIYSKWQDHSKYHSVDFLTRLESDVSSITSLLMELFPGLIALSSMLLSAFITLLYLSPLVAVFTMIFSPFFFIISKLYGRALKKVYIDMENQEVKYNSFIQESLRNIVITKAFCSEKNNIFRLKKLQNESLGLVMKSTKISLFSGIILQLGSSISYFAIFCWGAINLSKGLTTFGTLTALLQLYNKVQAPFENLASALKTTIISIASAERLMEIEAMTLENDVILNKIKEPSIHLRNISFSYNLKDDSYENTLNNINLDINYGETIALMGSSGEGKTTLIRLMLSLIYATEGDIYITDNKGKQHTGNFRNLISYVPQGNTLFSGTIEDNLRFANLKASSKEIEESLINSCSFDFINSLEKGLNTVIGEGAVGLSEGQAQRLAIARAFIRKTPILILDEATSALDAETELKVLNSIKNLSHKPTCIIITHRHSTLSICDKVYKLSKGDLSAIAEVISPLGGSDWIGFANGDLSLSAK